jgi:arginyl-tRNA synthetase
MKDKIYTILTTTLQHCFDNGKLNQTPLPDYTVEVPNHSDHGHFATNLPLALSSSQRRRPIEIAQIIVGHLTDSEGILQKVDIADPGFINFTVRIEQWHKFLAQIIALKNDYGRSLQGNGERVLVEYVSANPTGPLHLGHGRGAALGDTLCRILAHCDYRVTREFYINDAGRQIQLLGESIYSRWKQMSDRYYPLPENAYHGDYIVELAKEISIQTDLDGLTQDQAIARCAKLGKENVLKEIKNDLADFGMTFDVWYSEADLFSSGLLDKSLETIKGTGYLYEKDGALWIKTSELGDDKDRVIKKSDGEFTYFASDISYHLEKWKRGFSKAINIWGADHHGYVQRMKGALKANGIDEDWLTVYG